MLKNREIITVKSFKSKKKKLALTLFYYVSWEIWLGNSKKLICIDQSRFYIFHTRENSKMFNITSKYFSFFNNKPPVSWVAHITTDFLTSCSYSHYISIVLHKICMEKVLEEHFFCNSFGCPYRPNATKTCLNAALNTLNFSQQEWYEIEKQSCTLFHQKRKTSSWS